MITNEVWVRTIEVELGSCYSLDCRSPTGTYCRGFSSIKRTEFLSDFFTFFTFVIIERHWGYSVVLKNIGPLRTS